MADNNTTLDPNFQLVQPPSGAPPSDSQTLDPNFEVVSQPKETGSSWLGTGAGALQGIVGYPETAAQFAERATGYHFVPRWLAQKGAQLKSYAESSPAGKAAEFATSTGVTLPFRTEGLIPGALASIFNQPILDAPTNEDYSRQMLTRGALGAIPGGTLLSAANRARQFEQATQQHQRDLQVHQQAADRANRLNDAAQRQHIADTAAHAQRQQAAQSQYVSDMAAHAARTRTTEAAQRAQKAIPESATRDYYGYIYDGTGAQPPTTAVNPASKATIRKDLGDRLNAIYSRMSFNPTSHAEAMQMGNQIRDSLTQDGRDDWAKIYERVVSDPILTSQSGLSQQDFGRYMSDITIERERIARRARGQNGDSDDWKMVRGLRDIQRTILDRANASPEDRAALRMWNRAYAKWGVLDTAARARNGGIATPEQLIGSAERHSGNYSADYATDPFLQQLERLRQLRTTQIPKAGSKPTRARVGSTPKPPLRYPGPGTPPEPPTRAQPGGGAWSLAHLPLNLLAWHLNPLLGIGHSGYWLLHHGLNELSRNAAIRRAAEAAARRSATAGAAVGQGLQYFDPNSVQNPYSGIPVPGGGAIP